MADRPTPLSDLALVAMSLFVLAAVAAFYIEDGDRWASSEVALYGSVLLFLAVTVRAIARRFNADVEE